MRWEYRVVRMAEIIWGTAERDRKQEELMNAEGAEGWELVDVEYPLFYFKRPLP